MSTALDRVHITRLRLRNYRSVRECDVALQPGLTFLVGPNGAGKSNILDGLRFVSDALNTSLDRAIGERGGFAGLLHQQVPRAAELAVEISFAAPVGVGSYSVKLGNETVVEEACEIRSGDSTHDFLVEHGSVTSSEPVLPLSDPNRLYLVTAANLPAFLPVFDLLAEMTFYNLSPPAMRETETGVPDRPLARDGSNVARVLGRMERVAPESKKVIEEYLAVVAPGIEGVESQSLFDSFEALAFRQVRANELSRFFGSAMSDGTIRALGVLTAVFQPGHRFRSLVGIEEPEAGLHPMAAGALYEALRFASEQRQVMATSHSPDLLDNDDVSPAELLAAELQDGATVVGPIDSVSRDVLEAGLATPGEMLRQNQFTPDDRPSAELTG